METSLKQLQNEVEILKAITTAQEAVIKLLLTSGTTPQQRAFIRHQLENAQLGAPVTSSVNTPQLRTEVVAQVLADFCQHLKASE